MRPSRGQVNLWIEDIIAMYAEGWLTYEQKCASVKRIREKYL